MARQEHQLYNERAEAVQRKPLKTYKPRKQFLVFYFLQSRKRETLLKCVRKRKDRAVMLYRLQKIQQRDRSKELFERVRLTEENKL